MINISRAKPTKEEAMTGAEKERDEWRRAYERSKEYGESMDKEYLVNEILAQIIAISEGLDEI